MLNPFKSRKLTAQLEQEIARRTAAEASMDSWRAKAEALENDLTNLQNMSAPLLIDLADIDQRIQTLTEELEGQKAISAGLGHAVQALDRKQGETISHLFSLDAAIEHRQLADLAARAIQSAGGGHMASTDSDSAAKLLESAPSHALLTKENIDADVARLIYHRASDGHAVNLVTEYIVKYVGLISA